jgi:hypothetical protein
MLFVSIGICIFNAIAHSTLSSVSSDLGIVARGIFVVVFLQSFEIPHFERVDSCATYCGVIKSAITESPFILYLL